MGNENCSYCYKRDEKLEEGQVETMTTLCYRKRFVGGLKNNFASARDQRQPRVGG